MVCDCPRYVGPGKCKTCGFDKYDHSPEALGLKPAVDPQPTVDPVIEAAVAEVEAAAASTTAAAKAAIDAISAEADKAKRKAMEAVDEGAMAALAARRMKSGEIEDDGEVLAPGGGMGQADEKSWRSQKLAEMDARPAPAKKTPAVTDEPAVEATPPAAAAAAAGQKDDATAADGVDDETLAPGGGMEGGSGMSSWRTQKLAEAATKESGSSLIPADVKELHATTKDLAQQHYAIVRGCFYNDGAVADLGAVSKVLTTVKTVMTDKPNEDAGVLDWNDAKQVLTTVGVVDTAPVFDEWFRGGRFKTPKALSFAEIMLHVGPTLSPEMQSITIDNYLRPKGLSPEHPLVVAHDKAVAKSKKVAADIAAQNKLKENFEADKAALVAKSKDESISAVKRSQANMQAQQMEYDQVDHDKKMRALTGAKTQAHTVQTAAKAELDAAEEEYEKVATTACKAAVA